MTVEKVQHQDGKTIFTITSPTRYGVADVEEEIIVSHDPAELNQLPRITDKDIINLPNDPYGPGVEEIDAYSQLPGGTILVFKRVYDTDTNSATYRPGAYGVVGPYLLVKD